MTYGGRRLRLYLALPALTAAGAVMVLAIQAMGLSEASDGTAKALDRDVACTDCHREHQGHDFALTNISDASCQYCHADVKGFTRGHPEFRNFPYPRRTRINFDHVGHERKHFPDSEEAAVPGSCVDCHEPGPDGARMPVEGFASACGACHAGEIRGEGIAGAAGIAVITIPGLDLPTLREAEAAIGGWPELSDREMTPFMRAIFAGDPELQDALERFDRLDPLDLRDAEPADIEAVATIAWAVKGLFYDLIAEGPAVVQPKLSGALGLEAGGIAAREMLGGLTLATVRDAQSEWFPNLFKDVAKHRAGQEVPIPASEFSEVADEGDEASGSSGEASQESILGDDETGGSQESILGDDSGEASQESILGDDSSGGGSQESILGDDSSGGGSQESILGDDSSGGASQESILGDDSSGGSQESILGDDGGDDGGDLFGSSDDDEEEEPRVDEGPPDPNPESWAQLGGWYRDYFALLYRPRDHADPFVKSWIDETTKAMGGDVEPVAAPVLDLLAADDTPGKCVKCHSIDRLEDGRVAVNWRDVVDTTDAPQRFVRFVHAPHLTTLRASSQGDGQWGSRGCATCHAYNREADYLSGFEDRDPAAYASNFQSISRGECGECHVEEHAGNACVQCHDYHVGHTTRPGVTTSIEPVAGGSTGQNHSGD